MQNSRRLIVSDIISLLQIGCRVKCPARQEAGTSVLPFALVSTKSTEEEGDACSLPVLVWTYAYQQRPHFNPM